MPGTVLRVHVEPGQRVSARQPLVVLEAMKMETCSPRQRRDGVGRARPRGSAGPTGMVLIEFDETPSLDRAGQPA